MKKLTEKQESFVRKTLQELQYALFLTEYKIDIGYAKDKSEKSPGLIAEISSSAVYFDAYITIYPLFWEKNEDERREALVHEMCHIYTQPYKHICCRMARGEMVTEQEEKNENEKLTTLIERVVSYAFRDRLKKIH